MLTSCHVLTSRARGMLFGFTIAQRIGTRSVCHLYYGVTLIPTLSSNIHADVTLYYVSQIVESMSPGPEPYIRESEAVYTTHNHLRRGVMPQ